MGPHFITLCALSLVLCTHSATVLAWRPEVGATLHPAATPPESTQTASDFFSNRQSPKPPQLSTLVQTLSTYVSDALSAFFTAATVQSTNETDTDSELEEVNSQTHLISHSTRSYSPIAWLRLQYTRLINHFYPSAHDQSILSQTTDLAAAAIDDVLVSLIEAHNVLLMASIRDRPWYIRIPLYLYRRYSISYKSYITQMAYTQADALGKNVLLQQALLQFQTRFNQNEVVQPLASTIVDALEPLDATISTDSPFGGLENESVHAHPNNALSVLPSYIRNYIPSRLRRSTAVVLSYMLRVRESLRRFCYSAWGECWRMHMETMYRRAAPTALECTTLYIKSASVSVARNVLYGINAVVHFIRVVTNTVAVVLDNMCSFLAPETLSAPFSEDDMSYAFFSQFISLFRMALLMFVQVVRLIWTLTIYKRSFAFMLACGFFYRHWWRFLRFVFAQLQLLHGYINEDRDVLNPSEAERIFRSRNQGAVTMSVPRPRKEVGPNASGPQEQIVSVSEGNVVLVENSQTPALYSADDGDTDAHDALSSESSSHQIEALSPPAQRKTGWKSARSSLVEPPQHVTTRHPNRHTSQPINRSEVLKDGARNTRLTSEDSSVVYMGRVNEAEEKENRRMTRARSRSQTRLNADTRNIGRPGKQVKPNVNGSGNRGNKTGFDFAMRLLDINRQTAEHAREAMQLACANDDTEEGAESEELQAHENDRRQGAPRRGYGAINSGEMIQYAHAATNRPRRTRRKVITYPENE